MFAPPSAGAIGIWLNILLKSAMFLDKLLKACSVLR